MNEYLGNAFINELNTTTEDIIAPEFETIDPHFCFINLSACGANGCIGNSCWFNT
jgi:hypothetical protein